MHLINVLKDSADKYPKKPALTMKIGFRTKTFTYQEVLKFSQKFALYLKAKGIGKDDKVIICAPNSPYWICCFLGCLLNRTIAVPLFIQSSEGMINSVLKETKAKLFIKHRLFSQEIDGSVEQIEIEYFEELVNEAENQAFSEEEIAADQLVQILYTSGTTGKPKGVMLTHHNMFSNLKSISEVINVSFENDKMLSVLPLSHIYEQTVGFLFPFQNGVHIIYVHSFREIRSLMKAYRITMMIAVPEFLQLMMSRIEAGMQSKKMDAVFHQLLKWTGKMDKPAFSRFIFYPLHLQLGGQLKAMASGGAPLSKELEKKWRALGVTILQGYGLTETSPIITMNRFEKNKIGSVGLVVPDVEVKIAEDKEILVKGPNVFKGYFKNKEKTEEVFTRDGWFKTEDLGAFDEEGFLFLKGRKKYMILGPGGQNIYPQDIEAVVNDLQEVKDSCVLGIEDESGKVKIHAVLLLEEAGKGEAEAIVSRANKELNAHQQIKAWSVWPEEDFPRTVTRKIKREEVRKAIEGKAEEKEQKDQQKRGKLVRLLSNISGVREDEINDDTKIIDDLNLDSLSRVELIGWIEEDFRLSIPESEIRRETTVADLKAMVERQRPVPEPLKLRKWTRSAWLWPLRALGKGFFFLLGRSLARIKVRGRDNLRELPLPAVFMANHISYLDPLVIYMALPVRIRKNSSFAAAKDALYDDFPNVSLFIEMVFNTFPVPRREAEEVGKGLEFMGEMLDKGCSVVVFPEGRMSKTGELLEFKRGAGVAATEMEAWVVPVKVKGTREIIPFGQFRPVKRGKTEVIFGKPLKFKKTDKNSEVAGKLYQEIKSL